jgi:UDP-N-acetylmuramoylalanine--D-glutamate ligase
VEWIKGNDYKELFPFVNEKVKAIICLGVDNSKAYMKPSEIW